MCVNQCQLTSSLHLTICLRVHLTHLTSTVGRIGPILRVQGRVFAVKYNLFTFSLTCFLLDRHSLIQGNDNSSATAYHESRRTCRLKAVLPRARARLTWPCSLPPNQSRRNYACYTLYKRILGVFSPPSFLPSHSLTRKRPSL